MATKIEVEHEGKRYELEVPEGQDPAAVADQFVREMTTAGSEPGRKVHPKAKAAASVLAGIAQGGQKALFDVAEFGGLVADAMVKDRTGMESLLVGEKAQTGFLAPRAQAAVTEFRAGLEQQRGQLIAKENEILDQLADTEPRGQWLGEILAWAPLGMAKFLRGSTWTRTALSNTAVGGLTSAIAGSEDAESLGDLAGEATLGAVLGLGASSLYAVGGIRSFVGRKFKEALDSPLGKQTLALEKKIQDMTGNKDFHFTVGQIAADNPWITGLELGAASKQALARQNKNLQTLVDFIEKRSSTLSPEKLALDLNETMVQASKSMHAIARSNYGAQIDAVLAQSGDDLILDGARYLDSLRNMVGELGDVRGITSSVPTGLLRHLKFVETKVMPYMAKRIDGKWSVVDRKTNAVVEEFGPDSAAALKAAGLRNTNEGGLTAEDVHEIVKQHNKVISGERGIFDQGEQGSLDHIGRYLKSEMLASLQGSSSAAVKGLERARLSYANDIAKIRALEDSTLGKLFGQDADKLRADPEAALDALIAKNPEALRATVKILRQHSPGLLEGVKAAALRRAVLASRNVSSPSAIIETDLSRLAEALSGPGQKESAGRFGLGLFSPSEQQELINTGKALRTMANTYVGRANKDTQGIAQDTAINIISRSKEFMARYVTRLVSKGSNVEALLVDPKARKSLIALAENGPDSGVGKTAIAYLGYMMGRVAEEERTRDANERRERMAMDDPRN